MNRLLPELVSSRLPAAQANPVTRYRRRVGNVAGSSVRRKRVSRRARGIPRSPFSRAGQTRPDLASIRAGAPAAES